MAKRDYDESLGVSKNASDDEIKKAYRKHAMKHHPDRNQGDASKVAEEAFHQVACGTANKKGRHVSSRSDKELVTVTKVAVFRYDSRTYGIPG